MRARRRRTPDACERSAQLDLFDRPWDSLSERTCTQRLCIIVSSDQVHLAGTNSNLRTIERIGRNVPYRVGADVWLRFGSSAPSPGCPANDKRGAAALLATGTRP